MIVKNEVRKQNTLWFKIAAISAISILLLIPMASIKSVIHERQSYGISARREVSHKWSGSQILGAVVLSVPTIERTRYKDEDGKIKTRETKDFAHFLPDQINIDVKSKSLIRKRGIYKIPLYEADANLKGSFTKLSSKLDLHPNTEILWSEGHLSVGINEVRGLKDIEVSWNKLKSSETLKIEVGVMELKTMSSAVNVKGLDLKSTFEADQHEFNITMKIKGSERLEFYPIAKTTKVKMISKSASPSFDGAYLPESHKISKDNFEARWKILGLTRAVPSAWIGKQSFRNDLHNNRFGLNFEAPMQTYQLSIRAVKYALLFIFLTFMTMFFIEVLYSIKFHPLQYTMVGFALVLFYLILMSFSEHFGFAPAYLVAALATVCSISSYVLGITKNRMWSALVLGQLSALYGFLFVLLNLESYTLIFGASGLWVVLSVIMYVTRKVNWFEVGAETKILKDRLGN